MKLRWVIFAVLIACIVALCIVIPNIPTRTERFEKRCREYIDANNLEIEIETESITYNFKTDSCSCYGYYKNDQTQIVTFYSETGEDEIKLCVVPLRHQIDESVFFGYREEESRSESEEED